jgi:hypothetical protein
VPYCQTAVLSANSGGVMASSLSSLAVFPFRVLRGEVCGRVGVYMATMVWARSKRIAPNRSFSRRSRSGARRVRLGLFGGDDKWGPLVSGKRREGSVPIREGR